MSEQRLAYRLLTGSDDRAFCEKVSAALADGYHLHGGPTLSHDGSRVVAAQAVVLPHVAEQPVGRDEPAPAAGA